jgi:hypothetical protein
MTGKQKRRDDRRHYQKNENHLKEIELLLEHVLFRLRDEDDRIWKRRHTPESDRDETDEELLS